MEETYALKDGTTTGVTAEVVTFPKGYSYAAHDLFGSLLRTAAYSVKESNHGDLAAASENIQCLAWVNADETTRGVVCYAQVVGGKTPEGVIAWFNGNADDGVVTVRMAYRHAEGLLPGQVIDQYLRQYPSSVPENPTWHHDWETKDLEKWTQLLKTFREDVPMLHASAAYLTRYEKRAFGVLDALGKRDDATAYSQALDGVVGEMNRAVAERKAKAREPGQRGE